MQINANCSWHCRPQHDRCRQPSIHLSSTQLQHPSSSSNEQQQQQQCSKACPTCKRSSTASLLSHLCASWSTEAAQVRHERVRFLGM